MILTEGSTGFPLSKHSSLYMSRFNFSLSFLSLFFAISDKLGRYNFTRAKSRVLRNGEINNKFAFENECPGIKRRQEVDTIDLGRIRDVPFSLTHFSFLGLFSLTAHFLPFLTSEFLSAISQTSCTPLELSEIGPKEERPCPSSLSRRGEEKKKGRRRREAERMRKVIFRPRRFQSTSFSSTSRFAAPTALLWPRAFSHAKTFLPSYF